MGRHEMDPNRVCRRNATQLNHEESAAPSRRYSRGFGARLQLSGKKDGCAGGGIAPTWGFHSKFEVVMSRHAMYALLERAKIDSKVERALRAAFDKADADAIVRLGAATGSFVSHEEAAVVAEVAAFVKVKELTKAQFG